MRFIEKLLRRRRPAPAPVNAFSRSPLPYTRLSLDDWRSSQERVAYAAELLRQPLFLELVGMLANVRVHSRERVDATGAAVELGRRIGQDTVIAALLAAGTPIASLPQDLPPADYGAENTLAQWNDAAEETAK